MLSAGIDIGAKTTKIVILEDNEKVLTRSIILTGFDQRASAEKVLQEALQKAEVTRSDLNHIISTGVGRKAAPYINGDITEISANARGGYFLFPSARVIVDVGAEEGRVVRCDARGNIKDFATNEKCAAGAGSFVEAMARALEVSIEEFAELSLKSTTAIPMNAQCVIFAESEAVSLIHTKTPHPDISRAIHDAIADRVASMVRRVGIENDIILIGGVAKNIGFVDALNRSLELEVIVPEEPEYVSALGAALTHNL